MKLKENTCTCIGNGNSSLCVSFKQAILPRLYRLSMAFSKRVNEVASMYVLHRYGITFPWRDRQTQGKTFRRTSWKWRFKPEIS